MPNASMRIDQVGLATGGVDQSRSDGLSNGAQVTLTSLDPGDTNTFTLLWVPPEDTTAVSSLVNHGTYATFTPTVGVTGTYRILLEINRNNPRKRRAIIRTFAIRTATLGLRKPALGERADEDASLIYNTPEAVSSSENNEPELSGPFASGNYGGWFGAVCETIDAVESLAVSIGAVGTVTSISVASANGLAGSVANPSTTPVITLSTTITGLLKGNGTSISAAVAGTDYGTVTSASVVSANGFAGSVANPSTTPALTLSTTVTGLLKGDGTAISAAVAGVDYQAAGSYQPAGNYITALTGDVTASGPGSVAASAVKASVLKSATTEVNVSSATAPSVGQVLTATGGTAATWQTPSFLAKCKYATTGNITLSGAQTIDGQTPTNGDRILVWRQTSRSQNGIYIYNSAGAWSRASDFNASSHIVDGIEVRVTHGDTLRGSFHLAATGAATLGTDSLFWQKNETYEVVVSGTAYTILPEDLGATIKFTSATAVTVTADTLAIMGIGKAGQGKAVALVNFGGGQVTVSAGSATRRYDTATYTGGVKTKTAQYSPPIALQWVGTSDLHCMGALATS